MSESLTTADVMAAYLAGAGVKFVFGLPGGQNIEFMEAVRRQGLEFVLACREGTAALMADAAGQLTGVPGVCMSTLGPGSTNLVNGVANAYLDRSPMIAVSGQMGTRLESTFTHQNIDHNRLFAPITKWTARIVPEAAASVMRRALRLAVAERPGPVHITLNANLAAADAGDAEIALPPLAPAARWTQSYHVAGDGTDPARRLAGARRPVALVGMSAVRAGAGPALKDFAERVGCPVVVSPKAKGILAEDHAYFAGTLDMACGKVVWEFLASADLILAVGFDAVELISPWRPRAPVLHIDSCENTDQVYAAETELVGSIPAILESLADSYKGQEKWSEKEVREHREALFGLYRSGRAAGRLNPSDVVDAARGAFPKDTIITMDVGSHKLLVGQGWTAYEPRGVLVSNGLSAMGFALPGAIAAKMLHRDRQVVCFTGDGGLAMVHGEMQLASSLGLGLVIIVFRDDSLNRIEIKQVQKGYPAVGTRFHAGDLVGLAESLGCDGEMADTPGRLADVLGRATKLNRPLLVEARIDPAQYTVQF